jgi:hypothetical protein
VSLSEPSSRARRLLAIDACGAALTAAITLGLLASGLVDSGVPSIVWWVLGGFALAMALHGGIACWRNAVPAPVLRGLAAANVGYALASLAVVGMFQDTVTIIATAYVIVEAAVLMALAALEWRKSRPAG